MGRMLKELPLTEDQKDFIKDGYNKMRVIDLATRIGKSTRSIYRYLNELGVNTPVRIRKNYKKNVEISSEYFDWAEYADGLF